MHKSLIEVAKEEVITNPHEIFSITYKNEKYWVKKARATQSKWNHRFFYFLFPFDALIPSESKTGVQCIEHETSKLDIFRAHGINTPAVIYKNDEFFILEDCGETLNTLTRDKSISEEKMYYYMDKLLFELAKIHKVGLYHGGAQTRNFTYKEAKVYAIDLEESFNPNIDIKVLQFRDFTLLLLSFVKIRVNFDLDYNYVIRKYVELSGNKEVLKKLKNIANKTSFLIYLSELKFIKKVLGSDVKGFSKLLKILKSL
ncbi:MAG: kinase [Arcobacter sp.]|uniref:RIO1 family regulatory kinase/ATPase n=1 Tax=uncultured Arcobacter sp. TaxID=165434 RepID=UPI000CAD280D|nr:RIO1 family regulatory kinase/ATPase [uncultured Arcobacter sp.]PLY09956.1 MAG: kinase [Arcobacter sp.]